MTAVQQYILVDNEVYLVSGLYPVAQRDEQTVVPAGATFSAGISFRFGVDDLQTAGSGLVSGSVVQVVSLYSETDGEVSAQAASLVGGDVGAAVKLYSVYTPDGFNAIGASLSSGTVDRVVVVYLLPDADINTITASAASFVSGTKT